MSAKYLTENYEIFALINIFSFCYAQTTYYDGRETSGFNTTAAMGPGGI